MAKLHLYYPLSMPNSFNLHLHNMTILNYSALSPKSLDFIYANRTFENLKTAEVISQVQICSLKNNCVGTMLVTFTPATTPHIKKKITINYHAILNYFTIYSKHV